eukprot:5674715-Pyramimonas_sp.AAC.1
MIFDRFGRRTLACFSAPSVLPSAFPSAAWSAAGSKSRLPVEKTRRWSLWPLAVTSVGGTGDVGNEALPAEGAPPVCPSSLLTHATT